MVSKTQVFSAFVDEAFIFESSRRKSPSKCRVLVARQPGGTQKRGGGQRRRRTGGAGRRVLFEGHSLIVTNSRSGGDPVATREFSAQHPGKVASNLTTLAYMYNRCVSREQAHPPLPPESVR